MAAPIDDLVQIYLQPGEYHLSRCPVILKTVLGSCIGVTLWSRRLEIGALCHGVLPRCPSNVTESEEAYRYVDYAIHDLVRQLLSFGALASELEVKVFGGADVLPVSAGTCHRPTVGRQNWDAAVDTMRREGLIVMASDVGGKVGRTICFHTGTGEVLVRRLSHLLNTEDRPRRRTRKSP